MIKSNTFFIKNFKNVVFIGEHGSLKELVKINQSLNLNTKIVTSKDQSLSLKKQNLEFKIFDTLNEKFKKFIKKDFNIDETLFLSIRSRWIFKKNDIKKFFKNNLINYHPSRLPVYSGAADVSWRIMSGDRIDCQVFHLIDQNIDSGAVLMYKESILPEDYIKPFHLINYSNKKIIELYKEFLIDLKKKKHLNLQKQNVYLSKYHPRLYTKINGWIDWNFESEKLIRFINAFETPYEGASTTLKGKRVYLKDVQIHGGEIGSHPYMSGLITRKKKDWIVVSTVDENFLIVKQVLNEKNRNIIKTIKVGDRFITSNLKIFNSKKIRPKIGPRGLTK